MIYPKNFEQKIDFDKIRLQLKDHCISAMGIENVDKMTFCTDIDTISRSLDLIEEFDTLTQEGVPFVVRDYHDLRSEFKRIKIAGTCISIECLFELKQPLAAIGSILRYFQSESSQKTPTLRSLAENISIDTHIIAEANRLTDDKGEVPDNASPELAEIRRQIRSKQSRADRRIRQIMNEAKTAGFTDQQAEITIRNGRMVIPVKAGNKRSLQGFIHDESATGQTIYLEPAEIFEASNEIRELEYAEQREINRLLMQFTNELRPYLPEMEMAWTMLGEIDFVRAKTLLKQNTDSIKPVLINTPSLQWRQARHPVLEQHLRNNGKMIVPLDIELNSEKRILIISGPNAGGKSACLKSVGLIQYMLQCGLCVPMKQDSTCGIFDSIFIDIGDEQSLENDLSTFSSHLRNIKKLIETASPSLLFLIDEFGSGTEPQIGGAIAEAVLEEMNQKNALGVVTTHYANLKLMADKHESIVNGAMLFDTKYMQPTYILVIGKPGSSFAFEIAKKTGFPKHILDNATKITGEQHIRFEQQLQQLEIDKKNIRRKEQELRVADDLLNEVITKYQKLLNELEANRKQQLRKAADEAKTLIERANSKIEQTIKEIKETQAEKENTKRLRKELSELKEELGKKAAPDKPATKADSEEIKVGDTVCIDEMQIVGVVDEIRGDVYTVMFDSVHLSTTADKLRKTSRAEGRKIARRWKAGIADDLNEKAAQFNLTLDLRGMRAEEALDATAKYLDEAKLLSVKDVELLHGKGNGILRRTLREFLSHQHDVEHFEDAPLEAGGSGITRVRMR